MLLDLAVLAFGFAAAWLLRRTRAGLRLERSWSRLANRRAASVLICAAIAMAPRLALLPWIPPRAPLIMDEFSYLLGAQTLAEGRLTNPTPPLWEHFETFHVNMVPSYQSMYPPAPSLFYAVGILAGGHAWWGLWLSTGLMCAAICWALQPLAGPKFAFAAGLFCALKYGVFSIFSDWYLGGAVAAIGGALVLGAFLRLRAATRTQHSLVLVAGMAILANSRPFEGMLLSTPIGIAALILMSRRRRWSALIATVVSAGLIVAWMGLYNLRSTGSAWKLPYIANFEQYHYANPLWGMGLRLRPEYRHPEMGLLYDQWEGARARRSQTLAGFLSLNREKFQSYYNEHFAPVFLLGLAGLAFSWRTPRLRAPALAVLLVSSGLFLTVYRQFSSYPGPMLAGFFGLAMIGIRHLNAARLRGRRFGPYVSRGLIVAILIFGLARMGENIRKGLKATRADPAPWNVMRNRIVDDLTKLGGNHLILVKYLPGHDIHQEWVYNTPDISRQRVVFARSMGEDRDRVLLNRYPGRQIWSIRPDVAYKLTAIIGDR